VCHVPRNLRVVDGAYDFDLIAEGQELKDLRLGMPGRHNVENAIAAVHHRLASGCHAGVRCVKAWLVPWCVPSFRDPDPQDLMWSFIDDYAHHPKELDACIGSVREMYPGKRITGIFQPHLFTRTRDLAADFGQSLAALDELILLEIYPAREEPIPGIRLDSGCWTKCPWRTKWFAPVRMSSITCVTRNSM
jgi:UDP-N-acetylmuramate--alanine ligase